MTTLAAALRRVQRVGYTEILRLEPPPQLLIDDLASCSTTLTQREDEVMRFYCDGWTPLEISEELGLRVDSVRHIAERAAIKLGAVTKEQACAVYAAAWARTRSA